MSQASHWTTNDRLPKQNAIQIGIMWDVVNGLHTCVGTVGHTAAPLKKPWTMLHHTPYGSQLQLSLIVFVVHCKLDLVQCLRHRGIHRQP